MKKLLKQANNRYTQLGAVVGVMTISGTASALDATAVETALTSGAVTVAAVFAAIIGFVVGIYVGRKVVGLVSR